MSRRCALPARLLLGLALLTGAPGFALTLEDAFRDPPVTARPYVWWHWMGPNFSTNGITRDLESMRASGIGGATIFNLASAVQESHAPTLNNPWPEQTYRSPRYWAALRHAAAEADRLGLELGLHNTVGYSTTGGPWIDEPRSMQRLVWSATPLAGGTAHATNLPAPALVADEGWGKTGRTLTWFRDVAVLAVPADRTNLATADVLDLTSRMSPSGTLKWDAPSGQWLVYRLCHASTGRPPHPVPDDLLGRTLEADKMSLEQTRFHWDNVINPLREHLGPLLGKSLRHFLIDSYEAGYQNWTPGLREAFRERKGYDPLPWLITLGAPVQRGNARPVRVIGSPEQTARFEWDYRDVIASLYLEHGWMPGRERIHAAGATLQFEAYGGPFDTVDGSALADLPMVEFWTGRPVSANPTIIGAARAAGRRVIGAEAFTGSPGNSQWTETPAQLKASADAMFADGVNRMILHHWVHQPFDDRYQPGMGMGWWGTHFGRHQTWARDGAEFFRYLGRVQALLQRGETPVDILCVGTRASNGCDIVSARAFIAGATVVDGRVALPGGRSYPLVWVPDAAVMEPALLRHLRTLLEQGATVVSTRPKRAPGLANYPAHDRDIANLAASMWGDPADPQPRTIGRGRLFTSLETATNSLALTPPAVSIGPASAALRFHSRRDGSNLIHFTAHLGAQPTNVTVSVIDNGCRPELWNPETGRITFAPVWRRVDGRTEVDLTLGAEKSVFIVFRNAPAPPDHAASLVAHRACLAAEGRPDGTVSLTCLADTTAEAVFASGRRAAIGPFDPAPALSVEGPWSVTLAPTTPSPPPREIMLARLLNLAEHPDPDVRYFSGRAVYRTVFTAPTNTIHACHLDLGEVHGVARVVINGTDLGVLWHPPFAQPLPDLIRPGTNTLEVTVSTTWHNRLVGDEQEPADFEWGTDRGAKLGRALKGYPDWFLRHEPRPSSRRQAFTVWYYHRRDTPLRPSGLVGPVTLTPAITVRLAP